MPCTPFRSDNGATGIICTGRGSKPPRCVKCGMMADLLCDWRIKGKRSKTCDAPLCNSCTHKPAEGKDLCPEHAKLWATYPKMGAPL